MKYIKLFESFKSIEKELEKYGIKNYHINDDGTIDVDGDVNLTSKDLVKIPFKFGKVIGDFFCSNNEIESLVGCPYYVGGSFFCNHNKLISLEGSPGEVGGHFMCTSNKLNTLKGMPLEIGNDLYCYNNPNLKKLDSVSNIEGDIYCDTK